jgi:hypothetical protein
MLSVGAFLAVIMSFAAAALLVGPHARFVYIIVLFLVFFAAIFIPLSLLTRPLIEQDGITEYLDAVERKLTGWDFKEEDLNNLKRLEALLFKKKGRRHFGMLSRIVFLIGEMERLEKARTSFFGEDPKGTRH